MFCRPLALMLIGFLACCTPLRSNDEGPNGTGVALVTTRASLLPGALPRDLAAPAPPMNLSAMPVVPNSIVLTHGLLVASNSLTNSSPSTPSGVDYDIVYVRAPRYGDTMNTRWPEVKDPIYMEPGADLVLLHPDGTEDVLVRGGDGAVVDPYVSFNGHWIYFAKFHNLQKNSLNEQRQACFYARR